MTLFYLAYRSAGEGTEVILMFVESSINTRLLTTILIVIIFFNPDLVVNSPTTFSNVQATACI
jgi:hypothetical protein